MLKKLIISIVFIFLSLTTSYSHETIFPYDKFDIHSIYHLDTGQIIYVEKTINGQTLWEKNATGRLNKLGSFFKFYGIARECSANEKEEFKNIVLGAQKEYFYGGGINEFTIRMYHLREKNPHISYNTDLGMVKDIKNSFCSFYEPIN